MYEHTHILILILVSKSEDIKKHSGSIFIRDETEKYKKVLIEVDTFFLDEQQ